MDETIIVNGADEIIGYKPNIIKETEEEIGVTDILFTKGQKEQVSRSRQFFCQWFTAVIDLEISQFVIEVDEVAQIKWFSFDEMKALVAEAPELCLASIRNYVAGTWKP